MRIDSDPRKAEKLLPVGNLRENYSALKRADIIFLTRSEEQHSEFLLDKKESIIQRFPHLDVFFTNHKIELFGINHPSLYVVPSVEEIAVKKAVDFIRDATASVVVSGPLGAGKTTFMEILEKSLKKIPKTLTIRIEGISSADAFLDDVLHTDYGEGSTYEEFWKQEVGVKTLKHGSIAKRLSRILLAMRRSVEKLKGGMKK